MFNSSDQVNRSSGSYFANCPLPLLRARTKNTVLAAGSVDGWMDGGMTAHAHPIALALMRGKSIIFIAIIGFVVEWLKIRRIARYRTIAEVIKCTALQIIRPTAAAAEGHEGSHRK